MKVSDPQKVAAGQKGGAVRSAAKTRAAQDNARRRWEGYVPLPTPSRAKYVADRTLATRVLIQAAKSRPCADCGQSFHFSMMDFDHVRGVKVFSLCTASGRAPATVEAEMAKCEVVCANCHRLRTWERAHGKI